MKQPTPQLITILLVIFLSYPLSLTGAQQTETIPIVETPEISGNVIDDEVLKELINGLYPQHALITPDPASLPKNDSTTRVTPVRSIGSNTHVPNSVKVDTLKPTVNIPITSDISQQGAKTYDIPIDIFPGMDGMQPKISLHYNSLSGMGNAGMGWNISGTSSIVRGGHDIYHDGYTDGIVMDVKDSFTLDGLRLIKTGQDREHMSYQTERDNIKVTARYNNNSSEQNRVVKYFEVSYPDGKRAVYGNLNNTQHLATYPITELKDAFGNKITYEYDNALNNHYLTKISYNGASVSFNYSTRRNTIRRFIGGIEIQDTKVLSSIICRNGNTILREYRLSYDYSYGMTELLQTIRLYANGQYSNPLQFYYGEGNIINKFSSSDFLLSSYYNFDKQSELVVSKGRFDYIYSGDGVMIYPNSNPYTHIKIPPQRNAHSQNYFMNYHHPESKILLHAGLTDGMTWPLGTILKENGFINILCADLDGKQSESIVKINNNVVNDKDEIRFTVYKTTKSGPELQYERKFYFNTICQDKSKHISVPPKYYYVGDFTGNGKMEILAVSADRPYDETLFPTKCYLFDLVNNTLLYEGSPFVFTMKFYGTEYQDLTWVENNCDRLIPFDYNGDGKTDICLINDSGVHMYSFKGSSSSYTCAETASSTITSRSQLEDKNLLGGDFNADGLIDFIVVPKKVSSSSWQLLTSMGDGNFKTSYINGLSRSFDDSSGVLAQDVNGDGIADIISYNANGFTTYLGKYATTWEKGVTTSFPESNSIMVPTSLSSRNTFTSLISLKKGTITRYSFSRDDNAESLLTGMVNCHGAVEKNRYEPISAYYNYTGNYIPGTNAIFPFVNVSEPWFTIAETASFLDGKMESDVNYIYQSGIMHKQGLGFCGFERIGAYGLDYSSSTNYDPTNYGVVISERTNTKETSYDYKITKDNSGFSKILLTKKNEKNLPDNFQSYTDYTYDSYGYPTLEKTTFSDGITIQKVMSYARSAENDSLYYLGFLTDNTVTTRYGSDSYSEREYIPNHSRLKPLKKILYKNGNPVKTSEYTYDSHGNQTLTKEAHYTATGRQALAVYDAQGLMKSYSKDGLLTEYSYNTYGQIATKKDRDGTTSYTYDRFGRLTQILNPNGASENTDYIWTISDNNGVIGEKKTVTGNPIELTVFDALGREVRHTQTLFNGDTKSIIKVYDPYGNFLKISAPYIGDSPSKWSTYQYDQYGRKVSYTDPVGRITSYSYSGNKTTINKNGISTTSEINSQGKLISVTDEGGTISYTLAADGQPVSVKAPGDIVTTFTYDRYRRQLSMNDPSHGISYTAYNAAGQIASETDATGKTVKYEYDSFDRLTKKVTPEMTVEYKYDSKWRPSSITTSTGSSISYGYTPTGDVSSTVETAPGGKRLTRQRSYEKGLLKAMTYTSNKGILGKETYTYKNGYLHTVTLNDTAKIYELISESEFGPRYVQTYNLQHSYQFHDNGFPKERIASTVLFSIVGKDTIIGQPINGLEDPVGTNGIGDFGPVISTRPAFGAIFHETYEFDASTGNLLQRFDKMAAKTETFKYDSLNRLIGYGDNGSEFTLSYEDNGNILTKSDIGSFEYDHPTKPYAITGVDVTDKANAIPSWAQDITYTSFKRPSTITENGYTASFLYDHDYNRTKMEVRKDGNILYSKYYLGGCLEIEETADGTYTERLYLCGDYYKAPIVLVKNGTKTNICNIVRDYLGSIRTVVDQDLKVLQNVSYDPWGRLRPTKSFTPYTLDKMPKLYLGRGFTGHEHLPEFCLVNMNARLYDPTIGRFLSPDPFVQMPDFSQNFNRYAYCLNNPLCYVDENGEFLEWILLGIVIATGVNGVIKHWEALTDAPLGLTILYSVGVFIGYSFLGAGCIAFSLVTGVPTELLTYLLNPENWKPDREDDFFYVTPSDQDSSSDEERSNDETAKSSINITAKDIYYVPSDELYIYNRLTPQFLYLK